MDKVKARVSDDDRGMCEREIGAKGIETVG